MSSITPASARKCPVCDAPNSNLSLFCAECGASMNAPESDLTAAYQPIANDHDEDDAQRTAAFQPEPYGRDARAERTERDGTGSTRVSPDATSSPYDSTWQPTSAAPAASSSMDPVRSPTDVTYVAQPMESPPLGMRGFVLGLFAVLLMLAVFLLWTWATLLDQGPRDSIRDLFGFIG